MGGLTLPLPLLSVTIVILANTCSIDGKGSESHESSADKSGEDENSSDSEKGDKRAGAQHKFWMPTYQGTNPLNRRKISITTSEIDKYDRSIDVSLSGVNKNRTNKPKPKNDQEALSMPIIWSGEYSDINKSHKYDLSMASSKITVELDSESSLSQNVKDTSSDSQSKSYLNKNKKIPNKNKKIPNKNKKIPNKKISKTSSHQFTTDSPEKLKSPKNKTKYVEKAITSQFFDELGKAAFNETIHTPENYSKLVKSATELTKEKLGYQKSKGVPKTGSKMKPKPEIIAVDIDSKSIKAPSKVDEIVFKTGHKQISQQEKTETSKPSSKKTKDKIKTKSKSKFKPLDIETSSFYNLDEMPTDSEEVDEDSFTEFCDYSAWSDVLTRNKTERKGSKRKPKTKPISSSYRESREMGQDAEYKANKLRQKEGTTSRKKKRQREVKKKKQSSKRESRRRDTDEYDYDQDYPEKKLRMRTKGEKQHAINEVKGYLNKMDDKYGGRPGGDNYESKYDRSERGFKSYGRRDERTKGRDRRRDGEGGDRWSDRENNRDRKWGQREYKDDRIQNYRRENQWDTGRRGRGMSSGRGGGGWRGDRRGGRDGFSRRGSSRGGYRGGGRYSDRRGGGRDGDRRGGGWDGDRRGGGRDGDRRGSRWDSDRRGGGRDGDRRGGGWDGDRRGGRRDGDRRGGGRDGDRRGGGWDGDRRGGGRDGDRRGGSFRGSGRRGDSGGDS